MQFYGDMMTLIEVIGLWTDNINEGWLAAAVSFATAAGNVGKGIKDAIEGLKALMTYTGGLAEETILQFYGDMMTLIEVIGLWTDNISEDWLAAAVVFATAAGNVGKAIGDAIEGLTAIKDYSGLAQDTFDQFLEDIRQVMNKMVAASQAGGIGIDAALEFAENIAQIVQQIIGAMTSLRTVAGYEGGQTAATMEAFLADVGLIIADLQSSAGLMENGEIVAQTIATTGAQIGQALLDGMTAAASAPTGITSAFEAIVAAVMATFVALQVQFASMKNAAWAFGRDWVLMLINGMESRLDDLVALLAYIRGLFPSSPAKYGPFKTLPDGETVGAGFASSMADGLWSGAGGLVDALSGLSGAFGMRGGGFGGLEPVMAGGGGGGPITININNPTVRNDRDIELMAAEISDILARQAATNSRLGRL